MMRVRCHSNGPVCFKCAHADLRKAVCDLDGSDIMGYQQFTCPSFALDRKRYHTVRTLEWQWRADRKRDPQDTLEGYRRPQPTKPLTITKETPKWRR